MRTALAAAAILVCGSACSPDFKGEAGIYSFNSTLSRPSVPWTPAQKVAVGESFRVEQASNCLFSCVTPYSSTRIVGDGLIGNVSSEATAVAPGAATVITAPTVDRFTVRVLEPTGIALYEPLNVSRPLWEHLRTDGGPDPFPEVGSEIVIGADAGLYLDIALTAPNAGFVASRAGFRVSTDGGVEAISAQIDGRMLDIHSSAVGTTAITTIMRADGGLPTSWPIRVAGEDEIASIEVAQISLGRDAILRAIVRRPDGGVFFEPPITWTIENGEAIDYTTFRSSLRMRRDVRMVRAIFDAGSPSVTVSGNGHQVTTSVDAFESEPPPPPPTPAPMMKSQACDATIAMPTLLAVLALVRRRQRAK
ncbi:MAG: hypothetical protein QM817_15330 [Archangium sp.]